MIKKQGFTLAEVLITLVVIGVIAALTVPALFQNIQDEHLRTQWQKTFSDLSAATNQLYATQGDINVTGASTLRNDYEKVMTFIKKDNTAENLFATNYNLYKNSTGSITFNAYGSYGAVLENGVVFSTGSYGNNCTSQSGNLTSICGWTYVDINGQRPPNMMGKDLFAAWLVKNNGAYVIYPYGSHGDTMRCVAGSGWGDTSWGCSAKSLLNGSMP